MGKLVLVNHCYHVESEYLHHRCVGLRLLCGPCHTTVGSLDYYLMQLEAKAAIDPDQYPWDACRIGLTLYHEELGAMIRRGVAPDDEDRLEIAWPARKPISRRRR